MAREIDLHHWFAWRPVLLDGGDWVWLRWIMRRREFIGPRTAALGDLDLMVWRYYDRKKSCTG